MFSSNISIPPSAVVAGERVELISGTSDGHYISLFEQELSIDS